MWARGGDKSDRQRVRDSLKNLGADEATIAAALEDLPDERASIWPWQRRALDAFLIASTQWRWASSGGMGVAHPYRLGLDYASAKVAWDIAGITLDPIDFEYLRTMERAVIRGADDDGD